MARFHINPVTGQPGPCSAQKACPFGGADEHFDSMEEARENYEVVMAGMTLPEPTHRDEMRERLIAQAEREQIVANQGKMSKLALAQSKRSELSSYIPHVTYMSTEATEQQLKDFQGRLQQILDSTNWDNSRASYEAMLKVRDLQSTITMFGDEAEREGQDGTPYFVAAGGLNLVLEGSAELK